ncbi:MAG: hypothetical protein Q4B63_05890 [Clostridium perfringens]|nr:hypothetical protein [Clostridium perfringens]
MKRKGYFLVECALYIWFCVIFSTIILSIFLPYIKEFKNEIKVSTNYNYMLSASMYIENAMFNESVYCILVDNNELKIYSDNENLQMDIIKEKNINKSNKLVVEHYRLDSDKYDFNNEDYNFYDGDSSLNNKVYKRVATNTILKDIEDFRIVEKGNIIYITLKQLGGDERIFSYENKYKE